MTVKQLINELNRYDEDLKIDIQLNALEEGQIISIASCVEDLHLQVTQLNDSVIIISNCEEDEMQSY